MTSRSGYVHCVLRVWRAGLARRALSTVAVAAILLCVSAPAATGMTMSTEDSQMRMPSMSGVPDPNIGGDPDTSTWTTPYGPLSQYDRNVLINVRWADLWEAPTSGQIAARTTNPKVRQAATILMNDHRQLDKVVVATAAKLHVQLPDSPTPLQQSWEKEILSETGNDADSTWANITRQAHGTVFMLIGTVRAQTRNNLIRTFAQSAVQIVMRHMTLLEGTGLVMSSSMYVGSTANAPHQIPPSRNEVILGIVLGCLAIIGTLVVIRVCARYVPRTAPQ